MREPNATMTVRRSEARIDVMLHEIGDWLMRNQRAIRWTQWNVVVVYLALLVTPTLLPMPPRTAHIWTNVTLFAQFVFWGLWWPFVLLSTMLVGRIRGGTAYAAIVASVLFAGISGTAIADIAALGQIFINSMPKEGYSKAFAAALVTAGSIIGPIIPPSLPYRLIRQVAWRLLNDIWPPGAPPPADRFSEEVP